MKLRSQVLISALAFAAVAPLIGSFSIFGGAAVHAFQKGVEPSEIALSTMALFAIGIIPAYALSFIPAAASGCIFAFVRYKYMLKLRGAAIAGALIGYTVMSLLVLSPIDIWSLAGASSGAMGGFLACMLIKRAGPNNSSKPTPLRGAA